MKLLGILLIAGGALGLVYEGFTYVKPHHIAQVGSLDITTHTHEFVWVSPAISVAALAVGVLLLVVPGRR
ncbi:MAG: hypothetical protein PW734_03090 [Verrucomicrobium sp.]|nr:hypothetical protein [Verrucomicrobium sp.]